MPWTNVELEHLEQAMAQSEELGPDAFRELYEFHQAKNITVSLNGRGYFEARPLIAAAYSFSAPNGPRLTPRSFEGNDAHEFLARVFGFVLHRNE